MNALAVVDLEQPTEELLVSVHERAKAHGLVLITNGRELKYTLPHHVPPGYLPFALTVHAAPADPNEPRAC